MVEEILKHIEVDRQIRSDVMEELKAKIKQLRDVGISEDDIKRFVVNYLEKRGYHAKIIAKTVSIQSIGNNVSAKNVVSIVGKVCTLFEPKSDKVYQAGIIGDGTGFTKFVIWNRDDAVGVRPGKVYHFKNVIVNQFADSYQIETTNTTEIIPLEKDITFEVRTVMGLVVAMSGGLVIRCPKCYRSIEEQCPVHGNVRGEFNLDVKLLVSTPQEEVWVVLTEDQFKELTGFGVEHAVERAKKNMNRSAIVKDVEKYLVGRVLRVEGELVEWGKYRAIHARKVDLPNLKDAIRERLKEVM